MPRLTSANRPLSALYAANAISFAGNVLSNLAIPWFVLSTTGSAGRTGLTAAFSFIPAILAGIFGGTLVDRLGYKRGSIISDLASGASVAAIALLHVTGLLTFPLLLALVFLGALLDAPGNTARSALIPDLAKIAGHSIESASATLQAIERGTRLLAAPIAGLLIASLGAVNLLWFDAATFAVSAVLIATQVPGRIGHREVEPSDGYWRDTVAGFRFMRRDNLIFAIVCSVAVLNGLDAIKGSVTMPVLAKEVYNSSLALGLTFAASGGGAVLGTLWFARYPNVFRKRTIFIWAFLFCTIPLLIYAWLPPLWLVLVLQTLQGIAAGPLNPIIFTAMFNRVPEAMRGRVLGAVSSTAFIAMPLGVLIGGVLVDQIGLAKTFAVTGGFQLLVVLALFLIPAMHELDDPLPPAAH